MSSGLIEGCSVSGNIEIFIEGVDNGSSYIGGIAGYSTGTIVNCHNTAGVSSIISSGNSKAVIDNFAGGVCGYGKTITYCSNKGSVSAKITCGNTTEESCYIRIKKRNLYNMF